MPKQQHISYRIHPSSPEAHLFKVELYIPQPATGGQRLTLPAWIPGSYLIRDFAKNIITLMASCKGESVQVEKLDKQTWRCAPCTGTLVITYEVYAWDLSVRGAHLDTTHAYFNGSSVFLQVAGQESSRCEVEIIPPEGKSFAHWQVATTLRKVRTSHQGFGHYRAGGYAELIDHPTEIGRFERAEFKVKGVPHEVVLSGRHQADLERICHDLEAICGYQADLFGGRLPLDRYLFLVYVVGDGYGGLEHRDSCSLICSRGDLPQPGEQKVSEGYRRFLGLCSHEYFHLWNVKRIRPARFVKGDLSREVHTTLLWAFEGITSYYDDLTLVRSGRIDAGSYLELLAQNITRVLRSGGRLKQSVAESSFDAWTKFYKQDENSPNAIVSYYAKGALVALTLDLTLRRHTRSACSLDMIMQALWEKYGKTGRGVPEDGIERLAERISGLDMRGFFDQAVRGTADLDLKSLLEAFGIGYRLRPASNGKDQGGLRKLEQERGTPRLTLGARIVNEGQGAKLATVLDGSAAQKAGLAAGDVLVALDGLRVTADNLECLVEQVPRGRKVPVHAFRRDELMVFKLKLQPAPADTCELWLLEELDAQQLQGRQDWLQAQI